MQEEAYLTPEEYKEKYGEIEERGRKVEQAAYEKELNECVRKVVKIRIKKLTATKVFTERFHINVLDPLYDILQEYDAHKEQEEWGKLSAQDTVALFVTLSPEPDSVTPTQLNDHLCKLFRKDRKGITSYTWCIEQSGTLANNNVGYHPHAHAVIVLDKTNPQGERGRVRDFIIYNLKKYKTKSEAYLQIKPVSMKKLDDKLDYVNGIKDDDKLEMVHADRIWRDSLSIKQVYQYPEEPEE